MSDPGSSLEEAVLAGYSFDGPTLELGVMQTGPDTVTDVPVRIPLAMLNRHGLVAGATGTGKTKTLQLLAEQLSTAGVPVLAADIKGDLSGLACPGDPSDRVAERAAAVGQPWTAQSFPVELLTLGGEGVGVPLRATISSFGPILLAKVLGLNDTQESSLGLVFHHADQQGLPLLDIADLRALLQHLVSVEGRAELKALGGVSSATAGVILRELVTLEAQGADQFFGEPELDIDDLLRVTADGRGVVSLLELPRLLDRPAVFSTFLMWLLAELFHELPEVGDLEKPKLVFFLDEAHLLFTNASEEFLTAVTQTVRLIRSKGVGVFFVTQAPTDVPDDVLAQLGSRVQHQLRAHTPRDARALKQTVDTFPISGYEDLGDVLTSLGIGEAVVTVMDERGAPTPVAWTLLRAPESLMAPAPDRVAQDLVAASALRVRYAEEVDRDSAREMLARRLEQGAEQARSEEGGSGVPYPDARRPRRTPKRQPGQRPRSTSGDAVTDVLGSPQAQRLVRTAAREIARGLFRVARRR